MRINYSDKIKGYFPTLKGIHSTPIDRLVNRLEGLVLVEAEFTKPEQEAIEILKKVKVLGIQHITLEEKRILRIFLQNCSGSQRINKIAEGEKGKDKTGTITGLYKYSHYTRELERAEYVIEKAKRVVHESKSDKDKLSLSDYLLLERISKLAQLLDELNIPYEFLGPSAEEILYNSSILHQLLDKEFQKIANSHYRSGDFIFQRFSLPLAGERSPLNLLHRIFITKYEHAAKVVRKEGEPRPQVSHIKHAYAQEPIRLPDLLKSDVYRINPKKLLKKDPEKMKLLKKAFEDKGLTLEEGLQKVYEEAEEKVHDKVKTLKVHNVEEERVKAGIADYGFAGGHRRKTARTDSFRKIHTHFMQGYDTKKQLICSTFSAKSTIAALIELDMMLTKEAGMETSLEMQFLDLPFSSYERLKRIHPGRLRKILLNKHCIEKVPLPPELKRIFK